MSAASARSPAKFRSPSRPRSFHAPAARVIAAAGASASRSSRSCVLPRSRSGRDPRDQQRAAQDLYASRSTTRPPKSARVQVGAALAATVAARSYRIQSVMTETDAPGKPGGLSRPRDDDQRRGHGQRRSAGDGRLGGCRVARQDQSWTDSTRVWEQGGANYGLTAGAGIGPGQPISGFTQLVVGRSARARAAWR